jgi:hypothetical protein
LSVPQNSSLFGTSALGACLVIAALLGACGGGNSGFAAVGTQDDRVVASAGGASAAQASNQGNGGSAQGASVGASAVAAAGNPPVQPAPPPPRPAAPAAVVPACSTSPVVTGTGATRLSVAVGRASGAAPLAVFFDATGTVSSDTDRPFHDIEYRWNFGESSGPGVAAWSQGSRPGLNSRNTAIGPVAGHVYETPGSYTVTASDAPGTVSYQCQITVEDPDVVFAGARTACFSTSGNFVGCPAGASRVTTADFDAVKSAATATNSVRRLLMRRGERWSLATEASITVPGPGLIGAFGSGSDPVIEPTAAFPAAGALLSFSSGYTPTMKDWRLVDVKLDASSRPTDGLRGVVASGGIDQLTLLRVTTDTMRLSIEFSEYLLDSWNNSATAALHGHHEWDQLSVVDMTVLNMPPTLVGTQYPYGVYLGAERLFFAGNSIDGHGTAAAGVSHNARFTYLAKAAISNNTFQRPGPTEECIKLHSKEWGDTGVAGSKGLGEGYTRWVDIADNKFVSAYGGWPIGIGYPSSDPVEFRGKDIILERNWQVAGPAVGGRFQNLWWPDTTSRNNIFDLSGGGPDRIGIYVGRRGPTQPPPDRVHIYNNTFFSSTPGAGFVAVYVGADTPNVVVRNNLAYAPYDTLRTMVAGTGASSAPLMASNNSVDLRRDPLFSGSPSSASGFKPTANSYAVRSGIVVPVYSDFDGAIMPAAVAPDMGSVGH